MTKAKAVIIPVTPFQQNCTLLWCDATARIFAVREGDGDECEFVGLRVDLAHGPRLPLIPPVELNYWKGFGERPFTIALPP